MLASRVDRPSCCRGFFFVEKHQNHTNNFGNRMLLVWSIHYVHAIKQVFPTTHIIISALTRAPSPTNTPMKYHPSIHPPISPPVRLSIHRLSLVRRFQSVGRLSVTNPAPPSTQQAEPQSNRWWPCSWGLGPASQWPRCGVRRRKHK